MKIIAKYRGGKLANGFERDKGKIIHALIEPNYTAICGVKPGKKSVGWLPFDKSLPLELVNCKKCLKKLMWLAVRTFQK